MDPMAVPIYAKMVLPDLDPDLWRRLELLSPDELEGVDYRLRSVFRNVSFLETQKRAYIRDERLPAFKEWVRQTVRTWIEDRISRGQCRLESRQVTVSG